MLRRRLAKIAEPLGGVRLLALVGADGIPVEKISFDGEVDLDSMAAEVSTLARDIITDYQEVAIGAPRQFSIFLGPWIVMLSFVVGEYGLLLVADEAVGHGRARFEMRRARLVLEKELA